MKRGLDAHEDGVCIEAYARAHPQLGESAEITPLLVSALQSLDDRRGVILDLGAGEGLTLTAVGRQAATRSLVAVDLSLQRARVARDRGIAVIVADALELPLGGSSIDLIICRHVIEHVSDDRALLHEIRRVLKPGQLAYLETPLRLRGAWYPYRNVAGRWVLDPTHVREYGSMEEVRRVVTESGFETVAWYVRPIRYPVTHLLHRLVRRWRCPQGFADAVLEFSRPRVRVPRYREIQLLVRATDGREDSDGSLS